jgi:glucose uptake protein GlcU
MFRLRWSVLAPGKARTRAWGVLGGLIWGTGTICSFVAAYTPMVGPATSLSLGEGNTMISAAWGVIGSTNATITVQPVIFKLLA